MSEREKQLDKEEFKDVKTQLTEQQGSESAVGQKSKVSRWATISLWCALLGWGLFFFVLVIGVTFQIVHDEQSWIDDILESLVVFSSILFIASFISGVVALIVIMSKRFAVKGAGRAIAGILLCLPFFAMIVGLPLFHHIKNKHGEIYNVFAEGDLVRVKAILAEKPKLIDKRLIWGSTGMHIAAEYGHNEVVEFLISKGVEVDIRNKYGKTPLHVAAYAGKVEVAELLLSKGADINARDKHGQTSLHKAVVAYENRKEAVELLLNNGADASIKDNDSKTPLDIAEEEGYEEIAELLRSHGAKE